MTAINHQNNFGTNLTSGTSAGDTTSPLNSIPTIDAPFYLAFDATNINSHYEVVLVTSKTATNVNHAALAHDHTTAEEVRMIVPAAELDDISARLNAGDYFYTGMARQAIMNGNFDIAQRGISSAVSDASQLFLMDRWSDYVTKDGGTLPTITRSRQFLTLGDIANSWLFTILAVNGAGTSLGVNSLGVYSQKIEGGTRNLCGLNKKVTVSFYAKSDIANKRICPTIRQNYGTGGSPTAQEVIKGTPITLTSTWTKYIATFTTNTLVGKTLGTNGDDSLELDFWYMWGTTAGNTYVQTGVTAETFVGSGNIDIAQVQLCAGDVALPFQPKSYRDELTDCMRYYQSFAVIVETSTIAQTLSRPVPIRTVVTATGGGAGYNEASASVYAVAPYQATRAAATLVWNAEL
jgi:hypothetical protein